MMILTCYEFAQNIDLDYGCYLLPVKIFKDKFKLP